MPAKFQSDMVNITSKLATSRFGNKASSRLANRGPDSYIAYAVMECVKHGSKYPQNECVCEISSVMEFLN